MVDDGHGCSLGSSPIELAEQYGAKLLLVRPDQHVAWRTPIASVTASTAADVLGRVTGTSGSVEQMGADRSGQ